MLNKSLSLFLIAASMCLPLPASAQHNDPNLRKQINAVNGLSTWEFAPGFSYWLLHNNYSGASMHYKFPFSFSYKFDENKASTKRIWRPIITEVASQTVRKDLLKDQNSSLSESYNRQLDAYYDRINPIVTTPYKSEFEKYQDGMEEALTLALQYSKGKEYSSVENIFTRNDVLVAQMEYVCDLFPNAGAVIAGAMESGARQQQLERIRTEMGELYQEAVTLAQYCYLKYNN